MRRILLAAFALTAFAAAACGYSDPYAGSPPVANESPVPAGTPTVSPGTDDCNAGSAIAWVTYPDGLQLKELTVGTGDTAKAGEKATVQYTGWLTNCTSFDSSRKPGRTPFQFQIGASQVIPGWDEGVPGMKIGGKRVLRIPAALAYGPSGQTDQTTGATVIPPSATLIFDIELISLAPGPSPSPSPPPSPSPSPSPSKSP